MRPAYYTLIIFSIFIHSSFWGQLTESFNDGDFTSNPTWIGDGSKYEVNGSFELHSNGPAISDTAYLSSNTGSLDFNSTIV